MSASEPKKSHKTQIIIAVIGLLGAVVPGVLSVLFLVLDRTLPEGASGVAEESASIEGHDGPVYTRNGEGHFMIDEATQTQIPVYQHADGGWHLRLPDEGQQRVEYEPTFEPAAK